MKVSPTAVIRIVDWWIRDNAYAAFWQVRSWLSRVEPAGAAEQRPAGAGGRAQVRDHLAAHAIERCVVFAYSKGGLVGSR